MRPSLVSTKKEKNTLLTQNIKVALCKRKSFINNADFIPRNYRFKLKANRNIKPNKEIFTNYGDDY